MEQLIQRLERATANDEAVVQEALDFAFERGWITQKQYCHAQCCAEVGAFIDAALTLVPDRFRVAVMEWDHETLRAMGAWQCLLTPVGGGDSILAEGQGRCDHAPTPAIALCIASLKARAP